MRVPSMRKALISGALALSLLAGTLGPGAGAAEPLVILLNGYKSYGGNPNYNLTIWAEAFLGTVRVDLDAIDVTLRYDGANITTERAGLGTYRIDITYPPNTETYVVYPITVNGTLGAQVATRKSTVALVPGAPGYQPNWNLNVISVDPYGGVPGHIWFGQRQVLGGQNVTVEGRTRLNGTPADPTSVTASLQCWDGISHDIPWDPEPVRLAATRVDVGVYRASFVAPEVGNRTKTCRAAVNLHYVSGYNQTQGVGTGLEFVVVPFPVFVWSTSADAAGVTYGVLAGAGSPIAGAQVDLRAEVDARSWPNGTRATAFINDSAATDASGYAEVRFQLNTSGQTDLWVNVTAEGRTASVPVLVNAELFDGGPIPFPEGAMPNTTLYAGFRSPWPGGVPWNTTANYTMVATGGGVPLANETVYVYLLPGYDAPAIGALEARTDGAGEFTVPVPMNFSNGGAFRVVVAQDGRGDTSAWGEGPRLSEPYPWWEAYSFLPSNLTANATSNRTTSGFDVTAVYVGADLPPGARGWAIATPYNESAECAGGYGHGAAPWGSLQSSSNATTFEGRVAMPAWYPSGRYCLVVQVGNETWWRTATSVVVLQEAVPDPQPPPPPPGENATGFSAFFDAGLWIVALFILATVITTMSLRVRRRKRGDGEDDAPD